MSRVSPLSTRMKKETRSNTLRTDITTNMRSTGWICKIVSEMCIQVISIIDDTTICTLEHQKQHTNHHHECHDLPLDPHDFSYPLLKRFKRIPFSLYSLSLSLSIYLCLSLSLSLSHPLSTRSKGRLSKKIQKNSDFELFQFKKIQHLL